MQRTAIVGGLAAVLAFAAGAVYSRPSYIAPNAVFHIPSDSEEYVLILEAELVIVKDDGRRLARYHKGDVLPSLEDLLAGRSLEYEDAYGHLHYFDGKDAQRKLQVQLRKALFGM